MSRVSLQVSVPDIRAVYLGWANYTPNDEPNQLLWTLYSQWNLSLARDISRVRLSIDTLITKISTDSEVLPAIIDSAKVRYYDYHSIFHDLTAALRDFVTRHTSRVNFILATYVRAIDTETKSSRATWNWCQLPRLLASNRYHEGERIDSQANFGTSKTWICIQGDARL